jgi:hypothetical protein
LNTFRWLGLLLLISGLLALVWFARDGVEPSASDPVAAPPRSESTATTTADPPVFARDAVSAAIDSPPSVAASGEADSHPSSEPISPAVAERFPKPPGIPGQLPFAHGSIEERAWILRRALHDLQHLEGINAQNHKMGDEMIPVAIGGLLDLQGRGIERGPGAFVVPKAANDEYVFMSQGKFFVFKRFEFPDYDLYRTATSGASDDWIALGPQALWLERTTAWMEEVAALLEAQAR